MALPPKPFLRLDEVCTRWAVTRRDVADYALAGAITLSVPVVNLRVETGCFEEIADGDWQRIPDGHRRITGTVDLFRDDAWAILRDGEKAVSRFVAPANAYVDVALDDATDALTVVAEELVVCGAEVVRFESTRAPEDTTAAGPERAAARGARPRFDWDAFWIEVCRRIHDEGLPATQGALVRDMLDWFSMRGASGPDAGTVKKKLAPLWRSLDRPA